MIDGALLLDKAVGMTSNSALQNAKRLLGARKAGHAGTLDPLASGLLLLLFGEATKFAGPLLDADKEYLATVKLGEKTATGDAEGEVIEKQPVTMDEKQIASILVRFKGEIEQVPPMHSALKRDGVPLYKLARRGETVARAARRVQISEIDLTAFKSPFMDIRVRCSKGTYVRTLAEDIAAALGTVGHLAALRRTASGGLSVRDAATLDVLAGMSPGELATRVLPLTTLLTGLPRADLDPAAESRFRNGQALPTAVSRTGLCGVYAADGQVIGLGRADGAGQLRPVRLIAPRGVARR
jgi:tRNA pseudouridine55 synthase